MAFRTKGVLITAIAALMLPYGSSVMAASSSASTAAPTVAAAQASTPSAAVTATAATAAGTAFKQLLAGTYYSVALRADGTVWTWGRNLWGELGVLKDNPITSIAAPVRLPNLSGISAIATNGDGMQLGLKGDGTVWEWGSIAGLKKSARDSQLPIQVQGLSGVTAVTATDSAGIALTTAGKLLTWTHDALTGEPKIVQIPGTYKWSNLISYGNMAFALDASGNVWGLGARLENDGSETVVQPFRLTGLPALKQLSVRADYGEMFGVDHNGGAWTWKLTVNTVYEGSKLAPVSLAGKPSRVYPQLKVKEIQAGGYSLLLTEGGEVWSIGKGPSGKTGKVAGLSGIVSIAAAYLHGMALDNKGRIWGWGADKWYETGSLPASADGMVYAPVQVQPAINVYVNGKLFVSPFPARMDNGSTSVPMKAVLQALGGSIAVASDFTTTLTYRQAKAVLHPGSHMAEVNGKQVTLPVIKQGFSGVTMIPVGLLKLLGVHAAWDAKLGELRLDAV